MKTIVFSGPSIAEAEVRRLAACTHAPPIKRGDLAAVGDHDVFVILDGEFGQNMSVSPKEILAILDRGKIVIGAASMGALRASELDRSGMVGVGWVYDHFRRCAVRRDADVALVYSPFDYKPMTVPIVDLEYWMEQAVRGGTDRQQGNGASPEDCPQYLLCRANRRPTDGRAAPRRRRRHARFSPGIFRRNHTECEVYRRDGSGSPRRFAGGTSHPGQRQTAFEPH